MAAPAGPSCLAAPAHAGYQFFFSRKTTAPKNVGEQSHLNADLD